LGGKKDLGANITKLFDGATDREKARPLSTAAEN